MDIFVEYMIKRKRTGADIAIAIVAVVFGILLAFVGAIAIPTIFPVMQIFAGIIPAAVIYGVYRLIGSRNIEYEYILTNGELDIDMIISKRRRKRLTSISCRNFEIVAPLSSSRYNEEYKKVNTIFAAKSKNSDSAYFGVYNGKNGRECIIFEPTRRILEAIRTYARKKVFTDED